MGPFSGPPKRDRREDPNKRTATPSTSDDDDYDDHDGVAIATKDEDDEGRRRRTKTTTSDDSSLIDSEHGTLKSVTTPSTSTELVSNRLRRRQASLIGSEEIIDPQKCRRRNEDATRTSSTRKKHGFSLGFNTSRNTRGFRSILEQRLDCEVR